MGRGGEAGSRRRLAHGVVWCLIVIALFGASTPQPSIAQRPNPCEQPGNLTFNCGFDEFSEGMNGNNRLVFPKGWWFFVTQGDPALRPGLDTGRGTFSLEIVSDGLPYTAGIYQQVPVTPGYVYQADIGWFVVGSESGVVADFERKLGLDPTGGSDAMASSVIWSRAELDCGIKWPDVRVSARATGSTMTVFIWVRHWVSHGVDKTFMDAAGLWLDLSQPVWTATPLPSATPTRRPPTRTSKPAKPTSTATQTATATPTLKPTDLPTETATATSTPAATPSPTPLPPSPSPSATPTRTPVPVAILLATRGAGTQADVRGVATSVKPERTVLSVGLGALGGALVLAVAAVGLRLRMKGGGDEARRNDAEEIRSKSEQ